MSSTYVTIKRCTKFVPIALILVISACDGLPFSAETHAYLNRSNSPAQYSAFLTIPRRMYFWSPDFSSSTAYPFHDFSCLNAMDMLIEIGFLKTVSAPGSSWDTLAVRPLQASLPGFIQFQPIFFVLREEEIRALNSGVVFEGAASAAAVFDARTAARAERDSAPDLCFRPLI